MRRRATHRALSAITAITAVIVAGCSGDDTVVYVDAEVPSPSTVPVLTTVPGTNPVVFEQLWSPEPMTVRVSGTGALDSDPVTVDGEPATVLAFEPGDDDTFELTLRVEQAGGRTVCVRDECDRVFVQAAATETTEQVEAKVGEAIELAGALADVENEFPEWTIDVAEPLAGVGGTTDPATKTISVHANPGRTVDQLVVTALHEWGHVTDGDHAIRTTQLAPQPDAATLTEVAELTEL